MKSGAEEIAANQGETAAISGKPRESNPYPANNRLYAWWDLGWLEWEENMEYTTVTLEHDVIMEKQNE